MLENIGVKFGWTTEEARTKAKVLTQADAQNRMYNIVSERDGLHEIVSNLNRLSKELTQEAVALLELYPNISFRLRERNG